jgi:hypothetical protein
MRTGALLRRPGFLGPATSPSAEPVAAPAPFSRRPVAEPVPAAFRHPGPERPDVPAPPTAPALPAAPAEVHRPPAPPPPAPPPAAEPAPAPEAPAPERIPAEYLKRLAASIDTLRLHADRLAEVCAGDAIAVGTAVARHLLEDELRGDPGKLLPLVRSALRRVGESRLVRVRLSPGDAAALAENEVALGERFPAAKVQVVADPGLARGDVQVDADFGTVDGRLETRLARIGHALALAAAERGNAA